MKKLAVDDELIDSIVEEVLKGKAPRITEKQEKFPTDDKLPSRIAALENRLEKYIENYKINATELERQITERYEELNEENEKRVLQLQSQIETLRTAMIKLSNELKAMKSTQTGQDQA